MRFLFIISLTLFSFSVSANVSELEVSLKDLLDETTPSNCEKNFSKMTERLEGRKRQDYLDEFKKTEPNLLLDKFWGLKISIHEKLKKFYKDDSLIKSCANSARGTLRALRYSEDLIHEYYKNTSGDTVKFPDHAFGTDNVHVRRNPKFSDFKMKDDLKSGDIILSRGNAFTSAAISSLREFDTQFSHMSMVYRDEKNEIWTVEAHIEVGSFVRPLQEHIEDKNFRTMIFRYSDERVAGMAAKYIFEKVKKASDTTGNILYDFGFVYEDSSQIFCSEIISHAYDHVTEGKLKIPLFLSRLLDRKPEFVKKLGITVSESFIPADIEVDPRFTVIAEWRDAHKIRDNLEKDAILGAMFRWNDKLDYTMIQASSKKSLLYRNVAWPLRRVPYLKKYFKDKLPLNMSRKLVGYFGVLDSSGELLQKELHPQNEKALKESGMPLLRDEEYEVLESYRKKDLEAKKPKLHKMYRPLKKGKR